MLDTVGPELQVVNKTDRPITLEADTSLVLTPDQNKEATSNLLPVNFSGLSKVSLPFSICWITCLLSNTFILAMIMCTTM
jgi:hypothetical protein